MPDKIKKLFRFALLLAAVYLVTYYGSRYYLMIKRDLAPPPQAYLHHYVHKEPYIQGPYEFQKDVKNALATIKKVSPEQYEDVCKYCVYIELADLSTKISALANNRTVYVFRERYDKDKDSQYYIERILVHETTHFIQQSENRVKNVPAEKSEAEALASERQLLTALKVPPDIIAQVAGDQLLQLEWWKDNTQIRNAMGRN
ncbi:hypothetical protein [Syntrophomonas curvata]